MENAVIEKCIRQNARIVHIYVDYTSQQVKLTFFIEFYWILIEKLNQEWIQIAKNSHDPGPEDGMFDILTAEGIVFVL